VLNVAVPPDSVPVPIVAPLSLNVTVPVGVPAPGETAATVAVKVTDWPKVEGFCDELIVVVVEAWLTTCDRADEVLAVKLVSAP
jgi:hypothetical protein